MRRRAWLSNLLFAAVVSPALLQANTCNPPGNASLETLELWVPDLQGVNVITGFVPRTRHYMAHVPESEATAVLYVTAQDPNASIEVRYDRALIPLVSDRYARLSVPMGTSQLRIKVSVDTNSRGMPSSMYTVTVRRRRSGELQIGIDVVEVATDGGASDGGLY